MYGSGADLVDIEIRGTPLVDRLTDEQIEQIMVESESVPGPLPERRRTTGYADQGSLGGPLPPAWSARFRASNQACGPGRRTTLVR